MSDDLVWLDGNAAAGTLARLFTVDATLVMVTCDTCNAEARLGQLRLYGGGMGIVLRCAKCGGVVLRAMERGNMLCLDARGAARLDVFPE
jgi:Family of unknown function (DUF6510)